MSAGHPLLDFGQPATADDLVARASELGLTATRRLVTSWTQAGLLCSPSFRKSTRHGSAERLYPPAQRDLFVLLLQIREQMPSSKRRYLWLTLVNTVVWLWIHQLLPLPTRQAQRALRTHIEADDKLPATAHRRSIRILVDALAHPSAPPRAYRKAVAVLEEVTRGQDWDLDLMESALTEVCSPWPAPPGQRVERGMPAWDGRHFGIGEVIETWRTGLAAADAIRADTVSEYGLDMARQRYLLRHGADDLDIVLSSMEGRLQPPDSPLSRAMGLFLFEVGRVVRRLDDSEVHPSAGRTTAVRNQSMRNIEDP